MRLDQLTQSPEWDDIVPLSTMVMNARFFIMIKRQRDLCYVVHNSYMLNDEQVYHFWALSHDRYGITCDAEGSIQANFIGQLMEEGKAELTHNFDAVKQHIWEVMECHPNSNKLFTEYPIGIS